MQYKRFLLASTFALFALPAMAQKHQNFTLHGATRVIKTDTIVLPKGTPPPSGRKMPAKVIAANMAVAERKYKPVPLASEKSYYGAMSDYVNDFVNKYLRSHNRTLNVVQDRGNSKFSLMDNILQKHDIPKELKYLAVIESALNHNAVSHAGAVGPWQMIASTGRLMGLTINKGRDDRKDWYKSTNAAAKYLTYLYSQLNDWLLVVAAYNSGPTPVQRAIKRTGSTNFWEIKKYLPKETQGHVLAFIATATIFENMSKFIGLGYVPKDIALTAEGLIEKKPQPKSPYTPEELKNMAIVRLSEPLSMDLMAQELSMDKKLLDKWNPDYELFELAAYEEKFYSLRIPKDKLDNFVEKKEYLTRRSKQIFSELSM